jgi:hypothetical protein
MSDYVFLTRLDTKKVRTELTVLTLFIMPWLGKWFLFQTFEELDSIKNKEVEAQQIRQLFELGDEDKCSLR